MNAAVAAKRVFQTFKEASRKKSLLQRVREHQAFVPLEFETDDFRVGTARDGHELLKVLELRHEVFVEEWQGRRAYHRMDVDDYDFTADHLMIHDKRTGEVAGTYRLLSSHFTKEFYTAGEFDLGIFLRLPAVKLEMGRACVKPAYRNGATIDLLWKGLTRYIQATKTEYLFGCSSVKTTDAGVISRLYRSLRDQGSTSGIFGAEPTADYAMPGFSETADPLAADEKRELLPPLLRSYLHAGAKVHGAPALDRAFACTDLLTVLDWSQLNKRFRSRFAD